MSAREFRSYRKILECLIFNFVFYFCPYRAVGKLPEMEVIQRSQVL